MARLFASAFAVVWVACGAVSVYADSYGFVPSSLVDHPVSLPLSERTQGAWRSGAGKWGESFVEETLRLRGFNEVYELKAGGNQGIDRIAVKRGLNGQILDVKFVEVKVSRGKDPRLSSTKKSGRQMSRKWLSDRLRSLRQSGDPALRELAHEISKFRKSSGKSIVSLGEVVHINTASGAYIVFEADGRTVKATESIERLLRDVQKHAQSVRAKNWSVRALADWDQIYRKNMSSWLAESVWDGPGLGLIKSAGRGASVSFGPKLLTPGVMATKKVLLRAAGPVGILAAVALDANDLYQVEKAYRNGNLSYRERNIRLTETAGGIAGMSAGAWVGFATGAWIGAAGGPLAWLTVPAGSIAGMAIGGIGGYLGGSGVAGYAASEWYRAVDKKTRDHFESEWIANPFFLQATEGR